jgi:hypothetical protein
MIITLRRHRITRRNGSELATISLGGQTTFCCSRRIFLRAGIGQNDRWNLAAYALLTNSDGMVLAPYEIAFVEKTSCPAGKVLKVTGALGAGSEKGLRRTFRRTGFARDGDSVWRNRQLTLGRRGDADLRLRERRYPSLF